MAMRLRRDFEACECLCVLHVKHQTASRALGKGSGGGRVHIPKSSTLANWSPRDVTAAQSCNGINNYREFSYLGHLDFEIRVERGDDGANLCVFRLLYGGWKNHI